LEIQGTKKRKRGSEEERKKIEDKERRREEEKKKHGRAEKRISLSTVGWSTKKVLSPALKIGFSSPAPPIPAVLLPISTSDLRIATKGMSSLAKYCELPHPP